MADGIGPVDEPARDEQREVYSTLDLALRIGEVMLSSGAGTADSTATILAVTAAGGLRGSEVDITSTSMAISYRAASDAARRLTCELSSTAVRNTPASPMSTS